MLGSDSTSLGEYQTSLGSSAASVSLGRTINRWLFSVRPIRRYDVE
jgi:hypothetical protein